MVTKFALSAILLSLLVSPAIAAEFTISFEWGNIPLCTSGRPNSVPNPKFVLLNVPEGTNFIEFIMTDLFVPSFNHGGGTIEYKGNNVIERGAFTYLSPCPPSGSHTYRWTATAKEKTGIFSGSLGKAQATRDFPEK